MAPSAVFCSHKDLKERKQAAWNFGLLVQPSPFSRNDAFTISVFGMKDATQLDLEHLVFGNWGFSKEPRNFVCSVDEIAIFRRVFTEQEIASYFSVSHP